MKFKNNQNSYILYEGETGSGKTYTAIHQAKKLGKFVVLAPTRQLVYELYIDYAEKDDGLSTGEVHIKGTENLFAVYESMTTNMLSKYDTLVIDECHFLLDEDRGGHLAELVKFAQNNNKNVLLMTATRNFSLSSLQNFEKIYLKTKFETPKKIKIGLKKAIDNLNNGVSTIWFVESKRRANDLAINGLVEAAIHSDMLPDERLKIQLLFREGKIKSVASTNALAQGINMPAENLIIEQDFFTDASLLQQKIGRLGRPNFSTAKKVFYATRYKKMKIDKPKKQFPQKTHQKYISIYYNYEYIGEVKGFSDLDSINIYDTDNTIDLYHKFKYIDLGELYRLYKENPNQIIERIIDGKKEISTKIKTLIQNYKVGEILTPTS